MGKLVGVEDAEKLYHGDEELRSLRDNDKESDKTVLGWEGKRHNTNCKRDGSVTSQSISHVFMFRLESYYTISIVSVHVSSFLLGQCTKYRTGNSLNLRVEV